MSAATPAGEDAFLERLTAFRERGLRQQAELGSRLAAVEARLGTASPADSARATVTLDARGFPTGIDLSVDGAPTPDQLRAALISAFVTARAASPTLPVEAAGPLAEAVQEAASSPDGPAAALAARGASVSNDLGQATVTALFGDVVAIDAQDAWVAGSRPEALAADILALAQRAAHASDRFGRFVEKEDNDG